MNNITKQMEMALYRTEDETKLSIEGDTDVVINEINP